MNRMKPSFLLIGDSIIYGLSRYKNVWNKYFGFSKTVNCGISGDKTQHVLWRAENLVIPSSVKFIIVHCGTNNLDYDDPNCIAKGILNIGKSLLNKAPTSNILLTGLLPSDKCNSNRRKGLKKVNSYLLSLCKKENNMIYMDSGLRTLERQDSREVFDKDSYFVMQDIAKNETKKILSYYALSKIILRKQKFYLRYILLFSGDINLNPGPFTDTFPFSNSSFSGSESRFHLGSNDENLDTEKWTNFQKKGLHFIHININSLLPKIDEIRQMTKITNIAIVGIGETKLDDESILSSEIGIEGYDLLRLDRSRRGGGVACYVKKSLACNYRDNFCKNTESIFIDIFLPKTKPILIGILYRPPDKNDFVKNIEETFTNCNILEKQKCCLLGDFNINILQNGENVFEKKLSNSKLNSIPFIVKEYLDFAFSYSLKLSTPTRTTENTATLIDHVLTSSPHKIIKSGVVEVYLSDHELIYCTRKTTKLKSNKHNELNIRSMKNYTAEGFVELLKKIDFPNYETYACVNMAYLDFVTKIVDIIDSYCPSKRVRIKGNTKPWFDSEVISLRQ